MTHAPPMFSGAGSDKCIFDQFAIMEDNDSEDGGEDDVEIEGTLVDFPRAWTESYEFPPSLLIRVPPGDRHHVRCGLPSYELSTTSRSLSQLLSPEFIYAGATTAYSGSFDGISTSGGLVLLPGCQSSLHGSNSVSRMVVSNPKERCYRPLPQMIDLCKEITSTRCTELNAPPPQVMGIFMDSETKIYYIPVIQRFAPPVAPDVVAMQVYESNIRAWTIFGQWRLWEPEWKDIVEVTYAERKFFFLVHDHRRGQYEILFLEAGEWQALRLLPAGYTLSNPTIFEQSGCLMLGGFLPKKQVMEESDEQLGDPTDHEELRFGYIWCHNSAEKKWHFYCKAPLYWSYDLHQRSPGSPTCTLRIVAGADYICVASSNGKVALYDTIEEEWSWLPEADMYSDDKILILDGVPSVSSWLPCTSSHVHP